jgi:glycosyltransferase involved in cell wall biosynthesis
VEVVLRVLHIIDSLDQGGAEALVKDTVPRMRARRVDGCVAVLKELDAPFERELREEGIPFLPTAVGGVYSPAHVLSLMHHIREFDLVQVHLFPAQHFTPLAAMLVGSRVPLVLTEHSTHHGRKKKWLYPLETWIYSRYTAIACASKAIGDSLRAWVPGLAQKITVIPNGIDLQKFQQATPVSRASIGINDGNHVLLYVASFQRRKDHGTLLRAIARIPNVDLVLAGDGDLRAQFEHEAKCLDIAHRVHFLGRRSDVAELLKMADIYVHAPAFEGFGIAAAEAMASGKPIIASKVPGLAEVVGEAGLLIPPGDSLALATSIRSLIESPERRSELARAAMQRSGQFSIEKTVDAYIDLYSSVLSTNNSIDDRVLSQNETRTRLHRGHLTYMTRA